jgi:alkylation response protein AidB-like acyl-CoA dehydrogenase
MDLLSASVAVTEADGSQRMAVVLVPATADGIERRSFWGSRVLAGAESDAVELRDVYVPNELVFVPDDGPVMDPVQARGFVWFELLIAASYLGIASALVERVLGNGRGSAQERLILVAELESAMAGLEQTAALLVAPTNGDTDTELARALCMRYATERTTERVAMTAAGLVGGMAFIGSDEVAYLLAASRPLAFHPPSLASAAEPLVRHLGGAPLTL